MANFPRDITPSQVSRLKTGSPLQSWGESGVGHLRDTDTGGFWWTETFTNLLHGEQDAEKLLTFIEKHFNRGGSFTIKHQATPGSGLDPNGLGSSGISVKGANQTGASLLTDGWPADTTGIVKRGDVIKIGSQQVVRIKKNASSDSNGEAALEFYPRLITSPADNTSIATTGVEFDARIIDSQDVGLSTIHYDNKQITIAEAL